MAADALFSVYVVLDDSCLRPHRFAEAAAAAVDGGATILQFRSGALSDAERLSALASIREAIRGRSVPLLVNDRVDLALASGAGGVHLGAGDVPVDIARRLLGEGAIIGATAHSREEAVLAEELGADYVSAGCIFRSATKPRLSPAGTGLIREIVDSVKIPVVAIGGVTPANAPAAVAAGAAGVACIRCVWESPDWRAAVAELAAAVRRREA